MRMPGERLLISGNDRGELSERRHFLGLDHSFLCLFELRVLLRGRGLKQPIPLVHLRHAPTQIRCHRR